MRRKRNAKIIATLGPASSTQTAIESLFLAGADVFRLNFSHGGHDDHQARIAAIREVEKKLHRPIAVVADLQGPKLRVGDFQGGRVRIESGAAFRLDMSETLGTALRAPLIHPEVFAALSVGAELLLDDGRIRLRVERHGSDFAETTVLTGGELSNHKGLNVPNVILPISPLTAKDRRDLRFAVEMGADWIALSFVQRPEDVMEARRLIAEVEGGGRVRLLSKLEKPSAIEHLAEIVEYSDAVMVARGDLGVECPPETVPILQKRIVRACRLAGKPVVVATQMLESMIHSPSPTRAEASDVATAVYDGADAVMLSAETASGDFPVEAVAMMDRIIGTVEGDQHYRVIIEASRLEPERTTQDAISAAARQVAHTLGAAAIVTYTSSGSTTLRAARERPDPPILSVTADIEVARQMALVWGTHSVLAKDVRNFTEMVQKAMHFACTEGFAKVGDRVVITAGVPFGHSGTTNVLRVAEIDEHVGHHGAHKPHHSD